MTCPWRAVPWSDAVDSVTLMHGPKERVKRLLVSILLALRSSRDGQMAL